MINGKTITVQDVLDAIDRQEIQVYYQPQFDAMTNQLRSAEALARWVRPDGTVLLPGAFIPVLEKTDAICRLDWYMLRKVCEFQRRHAHERRHLVAVNFSRWHFANPHFLEDLCAIVDVYDVPHELIGVEITESAVVEQGIRIKGWVQRVRDAGFRVAMDDFGSGLSSLSFLKEVPINVLKIDRAMLSSNCADRKERVLLDCILQFARRTSLTTVAEGVENVEQLNFLRTSGCRAVQGFLMGHPVPEEEFWERWHDAVPTGDLLQQLPDANAMHLLLEAVFKRYPLILLSNLTCNSYYTMAYEKHPTSRKTHSGVYDELIAEGTATMHPFDRERFFRLCSRESLLNAHRRGEECVRCVTRQMGDDGVYRRIETVVSFVSNDSTDDVLSITLCQPAPSGQDDYEG